jgi:hypothetical protein
MTQFAKLEVRTAALLRTKEAGRRVEEWEDRRVPLRENFDTHL